MSIEDFQKWQAEMPTTDLLEKARDYIRENSKNHGKRWKMSIPPQPSDCDMVFGEVCRRLEASSDLLKEMERMLVVIQRIEDELPATWQEATKGTGIATANAYRLAIARAKGETI